MDKVLGLDIGTNSIGSSMVKFEDGNGEILHLGTRYIPAGGEQFNYFVQGKPLTNNKGQTVSECAQRRDLRSQRKNISRYKQRRNNLLLVFDILGIIPIGINYQIDKSSKYPTVAILPCTKNKTIKHNQYKIENTELYKVYELRNRAINGALSLNEFGRVLYTLNIRRGYQDIGLMDTEDETEAKAKKLKPNQRISKLNIINASFANKFKNKKPEFEFLAMENDLDQIAGKAYIPYFEKYIGKTSEFILEKDKEGTIELKLYKKTEWSKSREENNASLGIKTIGEKLFEEIIETKNNLELKHWNLKLRNRVYDRRYYKDEFEKIWEKQVKQYPALANPSNECLVRITKVLCPKNEEKQKLLIEKGLRYILKDYIIFYQRPLKKGQKNLISKCIFEKPKIKINREGKQYTIVYNGIAKSHPSFQEFRIWQTINNIVIKNNIGDVIFLDDNHYKLIYELLSKKESVSPSEILKKLNFSPDSYFINYREGVKITGNKTFAAINKCFQKGEKEDLNTIVNDHKKYNLLWHIIYSIPLFEKEFKQAALLKVESGFNLSKETAIKLSQIKLEEKYSSLSHKAISKILPLMKRGDYFKENEILPEVKERIKLIIIDGVADNLNPKLLEKISSFNLIHDFQGLRYDEAAEIVYLEHTKAKITAEYIEPNDIRFIKQHSLRHPVVEKIINETLKTVKEIWEDPTLGKPTQIAVELARELQNSQKQRESIYKSQQANKDVNDEAKNELKSDKFNIDNPTLKQIERYKLWIEQKHHCAYTDCYISPKDLFGLKSDGEYKYDIDHIIPRKRLKDESFSNKVLCLRDANLAKGSQLARAFMENVRNHKELRSFQDFSEWAKQLPLAKRTKLLMKDEDLPDDFIERQLKETQYITKRVIEELSKIVGSENIIFTTGGITSLLRHEWGVDDILKRELKNRYKKWELKLSDNGIIKELVKEVNNKVIINEFSKRVDLRNHALDALVVACTTPKHIKYFNDLNKIWQDDKSIENKSLKEFVTELINDNGKAKLRLKKPWKNFCPEVISAIKEIIISIKNNKVYTNKEKAIKGMLHDQKPIGWRFIAETPITINEFIKELKKLKTKENINIYIENHLPYALRLKVINKLNSCDFNIKSFETDILEHPLLDKNNNAIESLFIYNKKLVSKVSLLNLPDKAIKENLIVDKIILEELKAHVNNFKTYKEAFLPESLDLFNTEREDKGKFPIHKILTRGKENFDPTDNSSNNRIIQRKNSFNTKTVFALKDKAYSVIYEGKDSSGNTKRKHMPISLFDYINSIRSEVPFIEKFDGFDKYLLFDSYNYMYMPEPNEIVTFDTFDSKTKIFQNLYYLKRISGNDWYFLPHYISKPFIEKIKISEEKEIIIREFGASTEDFVRDLNYNLTIKDYGIPVTVDRIGNVKKIKWEPL